MKYFIVFFIVVGVIITYLILPAAQPAINEIIVTANASADLTNFPSAQHVVEAWPLYIWFIPGFVGVVLIVVTLRAPNPPPQ